jgi:Xaa-Pro aminopeptidase
MKELMPKVCFTDCTELMYRVRKIKSPLEIEKIKKAVYITQKAYEYAIPQIKEGMSERELASLIARGMAENSDEGGARNPWFIFVYADGKDPAAWDGIPSSYQFRKGDCIYIDCGAVYHGYYSDFIRIASIGEPSEAKQRIYYGARNANMALIDRLEPGMKVSSMCGILAKELTGQGLGREVRIMQQFGGMYEGHGIGLSIHEPPVIKADSDEILFAGMTLAIEGNVFDDLPLNKTKIALKNEENVLITQDGCELLTTMPNDIYIV